MDFGKSIPRDDMSKYMTSQKLLESGYLLANDNISVHIETTRLRILGIYAYSKFGKLHQLVYDTNMMEQYKGLWGVFPSYNINGNLCLPFWNDGHLRGVDTYKSYKPSDINYDPGKNVLRMKGIKMYDEKKNMHEPIDFTISLNNDTIVLRAEYPQNADKKIIHLPWYPLYDKYSTDKGDGHHVEYYNWGYEGGYNPHFKKDVGNCITLYDSSFRQAGIRIKTGNGRIELVSATEPSIGNAFKLTTDIVSNESTIETTS